MERMRKAIAAAYAGVREAERYRVIFRGRFTADGARGTLRARMQITEPGSTYHPCDSGTRRWTASGVSDE